MAPEAQHNDAQLHRRALGELGARLLLRSAHEILANLKSDERPLVAPHRAMPLGSFFQSVLTTYVA